MFDAFTSTWQNELFSVHKMSSVQMMCGVNFFSVVLTSSSLLQQGTFYTSLVFMSQFPPFVFDCVLLSLCSACGQVRTYALYLRLSYQVIKYLEWLYTTSVKIDGLPAGKFSQTEGGSYLNMHKSHFYVKCILSLPHFLDTYLHPIFLLNLANWPYCRIQATPPTVTFRLQ